jgi:lipoate-protein ligase A
MHSPGTIVGNAHPTDVRLIIDPPASGPWNMGVDEALLMDAVENGVATLRFYQWSESTLSLGYFQRYADREQHTASRNCAVVRRQTGGGAILHDRELTYSLSLPPNHVLARDAGNLYANVHRAFIGALSAAGPAESPRTTLRIRGDDARPQSPAGPFLCFQRQSAGDVILIEESDRPATESTSSGSTSGHWKVLGSAQRRHRGAILQHGSLLVEASPAAPELPGLRNLNGPDLPIKELIEAACRGLSRTLNVRLVPAELSAELQSKAANLTNNKYGSPAWTNRR